ncbi:MAG: YHS domain-containing protein, partial [Rhodopirellula sp.]|nr:YHS domain-containing protein [Rhodopirellula sp.]
MMAKDPICGMTVDETQAISAERDGKTFYFCSEHCRKKFLGNAPSANVAVSPCCGGKAESSRGGSYSGDESQEHGDTTLESPQPGKEAHGNEQPSCCQDKEHSTVKPSAASKYFCPMCPGVVSDKPGDCPKCGMALERNSAWKPTPGKTIYTCPMHPEVQQDHPGDCPKCGMALEPKTVTAGEDDEENAELRDMTRRFWIGAALTLPVFVLAMAHMIPVLGAQPWVTGDVSRWIQFVLTIPVVCWAGWPFFQRGWRSIVTLNLNMFTLIAIGVGAAFVFSVVAMLAPGLFPPTMLHAGKVAIYFEAAGMVTVLVLLGQVLELRARSRTGSAIKALLDLAPPTARQVAKDGDHEVPLDQVKVGDWLRVVPGDKVPVDG